MLPKNAITDYAEALTTSELPVLSQLVRETHLKTIMPQMVSGHFQGRLLTMLTQMIQPKRILEIGTFTGYTAISFAMGLSDGGLVHTIEINEELEDLIRKYLKLADVEKKVELILATL